MPRATLIGWMQHADRRPSQPRRALVILKAPHMAFARCADHAFPPRKFPKEWRNDMTRGLPRTLARAAAREAGLAPPKLGLKAVPTGQGGSYRTVFTFAGMQVP